MPKTNKGVPLRETRRTTTIQTPPRGTMPIPASLILKQTTQPQLDDLANLLKQQQTPCLACPPDRDEIMWPSGPAGPDGFLQTVADDPDNPFVLSCPASPERYIQACQNAVHQDIRKLNDRKIQLGPQPALRYAISDRNLYQWGICNLCRQELSALYGGPDRDQQNAAALRWGLAAYTGRIYVSYEWQQHGPAKTERRARDDQGAQDLHLAMEQAKQWRQKGTGTNRLAVVETTIELPLRIAGYMPSWQETGVADTPPKVAIAAVWSETTGANRAQYQHRLVAGCAAEHADDVANARAAARKCIDGITALMSSGIRAWLPELGGYWEYLYLSPTDYASKKRVPPRVKRLMEAACGQRLNNA